MLSNGVNIETPSNPAQCATVETKVERRAFRAPEVRHMLGDISHVSLWRLEKLGLIRPIPGLTGRAKLYSAQEIERFLSSGCASAKGRN